MFAAYRDPLCGNTLYEAFEHAKYPNRIHAVVIQQKSENEVDCLQDYCTIDPNCRRDQVRIQTVPLDHSRGVMPGRFRQHLFIRPSDDFCLQADAHSAFEDFWDTMAIEDWLSLDNEMAVITAYPNRVADRHKQKYTPARCSTKFDSRMEIIHGGNAAHNIPPKRYPTIIPYFGAGTAFNKCHANLNVPYDPYMSYMFGGEEFNRAARLWTWGYDMYQPKHNFLYHYYDSEEKPPQAKSPRKRDFVSAENFKGELAKQSVARWRILFGLSVPARIKHVTDAAMEDATLYGFGNRRKLSDYLKFAGVNFETKNVESKCSEIGKLKWHPYAYDEKNFDPTCYKDKSGSCCTTVDLIRQHSIRMLRLSNRELNEELVGSTEYDVGLLQPLISPLAKGDVECPRVYFDPGV